MVLAKVNVTPGANPITLFTYVIYGFRVCVPVRPFQPSLMFTDKARSLLSSGPPERLQPYPKH
jgi:hypothetical protein